MQHGDEGYTLLEILVSMAIMAMLLGVVGAQLFTAIASARFDATAEDIVDRISMLRARAYLDGRPVTLGHEQAGATLVTLDVPSAWELDVSPITISATGACTAGTVRIASPEGRERTYRINAPDCSATRL